MFLARKASSTIVYSIWRLHAPRGAGRALPYRRRVVSRVECSLVSSSVLCTLFVALCILPGTACMSDKESVLLSQLSTCLSLFKSTSPCTCLCC